MAFSLYDRLACKEIPALSGLRAFAVFLVLLTHYWQVKGAGYLGVTIFFVLSGFLITWLLLKEADRDGGISLRRFYVRRALRILPALYVFLACFVVALWASHAPVAWGQIASVVFFANNYYSLFNGLPHLPLGHLWSLSVEEQFYLLWPTAFRGLRTDAQRTLKVLAGVCVVIWIYRTGLALFAHLEFGWIYSATETRGDHLLAGCALAFVHRFRIGESYWERLCRPAWGPLVPLALLMVPAMTIFDTNFHYIVSFALDPLLIGIFLTQVIVHSRSGFWRLLDSGAMRFLGTISYPLYLYHTLTRSFAARAMPHWPIARGLIATLLAVVLASGSYFLVERWFLAWKNRLAAKPLQSA